MNTLAYVLEKIKSINDKYDEIDKINGVNFNIFSILNMERKEVNTHSNFIYELLNPNGLHNKGDVFLKLFFGNVLELNYDTLPGVYQVVQEDTTSEKRRIDFTIESKEFQIGIEMKIDAKDQNHQLFDYYYELDRRKKDVQVVHLFYLTLGGNEPSESSIKKSDKILSDSQYKLISFESHIINWLEECIKESATNTTIREVLIQYLNLVNKITNKSNSKGRKMEMGSLFSKNGNLKAFLEAENDVIEAKIELQCKFWNTLIKKLRDEKMPFEFIDSNKSKNIEEAVEKYYKNKKNNRGFEYILSLDDEGDLCITITLEDIVYYAVTSRKDYNKYFDKIKNIKRWDVCMDCWCDDFTPEKLNFYDLLKTPKVLQLFDDNILNKIVADIVNEIKNIKQKIDEILKQI